jgi:hypothetical protein
VPDRGFGWARDERPKRGCLLYGATHFQQLVELAGEGKQLHWITKCQHKTIDAPERLDVEIKPNMAQQRPAVSNNKPRGECVSRYLAQFGNESRFTEGKILTHAADLSCSIFCAGDINYDPSGVAQDMYRASEGVTKDVIDVSGRG